MDIFHTLRIGSFSKYYFIVATLSVMVFFLFATQSPVVALLGTLATIGLFVIKEYFPWGKIKNSISNAYTSIKEKIFPSSFNEDYIATPINRSCHDQDRGQIRTSLSQDNLLSDKKNRKSFVQ